MIFHIAKKMKVTRIINCQHTQITTLGMKYTRQRTLVLFSKMLELDSRHYCATLLHPDYRSLRGCSIREKLECHQEIRHKLKNMHQQKINKGDESSPKKRLKFDPLSMLDDFKDDPKVNNDDEKFSDDDEIRSIEYLRITQSDELSKYLSMKINMDEFSSNAFTFWRNNANEFLCLSRMARQIYSIPATSATVERQFSVAGLTLSERRNSLDPEQLDNIMCIRALEKI